MPPFLRPLTMGGMPLVWDPRWEKELAAQLAPKIAAYDAELHQTLREHEGKPSGEILKALMAVTRRHGLERDVEVLRKLAETYA